MTLDDSFAPVKSEYAPNGFIQGLSRSTDWGDFLSRMVFATSVIFQMVFLLPIGGTLLLLAVAWLVIWGPYFGYSIIRAFILRISKQPPQRLESVLRARQSISENVLIAAAIVSTQIPMMLPFWISEPSLDRYANHLYTEVPMMSPPLAIPCRCGLYHITGYQLSPNHVVLTIHGKDLIYSPNVSSISSSDWIRHIGGPWFMYTWDVFTPTLRIF